MAMSAAHGQGVSQRRDGRRFSSANAQRYWRLRAACLSLVFAAAALGTLAPAALAATGSISGQVTTVSSGCPSPPGPCAASGVSVQAFSYPSDAPVGSPVLTDPNGQFTIAGLAAGSYAVSFQKAGLVDQYYNDEPSLAAANPVTVTAGSTNLGFVTMQPETGSISGNVIAAGAGPGRELANAEIIARPAGSGGNGGASAGPGGGTGCSDANGNYTISGLALGSTQVTFTTGNYGVCPQSPISSFLADASATANVTAGTTTTGIDGALPVKNGASLAIGRLISASTGHPLPDSQSFVYLADPTRPSSFLTDSNGAFVVAAAPGPEHFDFGGGIGPGTTWDQIETLTVTSGQTLGLGDLALQPAGAIAGTVTNAVTHQPLAGVRVVAADTTPGSSSLNGGAIFAGGANTDANGHYTMLVRGFASSAGQTNTYTVTVRPLPSRSSQGTLPPTLLTQGGVIVTSGQTTPLNLTANPGSSPGPTPGPPAAPGLSIAQALARSLAVSGRAATIKAILRSGGYKASVTAAAAGKLTIDWYYVPPGAHLSRVLKPTLAAAGSRRFSRAGVATIELRLTAKGRVLLKRAKQIKLTAVGSFAPKHGKVVSKRRSITIRKP
jgi:hypothetical protein